MQICVMSKVIHNPQFLLMNGNLLKYIMLHILSATYIHNLWFLLMAEKIRYDINLL